MAKNVKEEVVIFNRGLNTSLSDVGYGVYPISMDNAWLSYLDKGGAVEMMTGRWEMVDESFTGTMASIFSSVGDDSTRVYFSSDGSVSNPAEGSIRYFDLQESGALTPTTLKEGLVEESGGVQYGIVELDDKVMFFNGTDAGFYDASDTPEDLGADRPDASNNAGVYIELSPGGSDNVVGRVVYYISEVQAGNVESPLSVPLKQAAGQASAGSGWIDCGTGNRVNITIDAAVTTSLANKKFRLYRSFRDDVQGFTLMDKDDTGDYVELEPGVGSTSYIDDLLDENLGDLPYAHGDPPPTAVRAAVVHFDRVFGLDGPNSRLYWTDLSNSESWWVEDRGNQTPVMRNDGDVGTAIVRTRDGIVVFKRHHMYKLRGRTPDQFYFDEITLSDATGRNIGTPNLKSVVSVAGSIIFYYGKAVYAYTGSGFPVKISGPIDASLANIHTDHEAESVAIGYYPQRNQVWLSVPTDRTDDDQTGADITFIYDIDSRAWIGAMNEGFRAFHYVPIQHSIDAAVFKDATEYSALGEVSGPFFLATDPDANTTLGGKMWRMDTAGNIETSAFVTMSPFYGSSPTALKRILYVDIVAESSATAQPLFFQWRADSENQQADFVSTALDLDATNKDRVRQRVNIGQICQAFEMKLASSGATTDDPWKVYSITIGYQEFESISR